MNDKNIPAIFAGENYTDKRGTLIYFNELDLSPVRRVYILEHPDSSIIRAWQGHQHENKWFHVFAGSFKIVLIKPDDWVSPSEDLICREFNLTSFANQVLHIPGGFATGFQAIEPGSKIMVFSNFTVKESLSDDFRFKQDMWYDWFPAINKK